MIRVLTQLNLLLDKKQKKKFLLLFFLMIIFSILEFLSIGIIIPISTLILDGTTNSRYFNFEIQNFFGTDYSKNNILAILFATFFILFIVKFIYSIFFIYLKNSFLYSIRNSFSQRIFNNYLVKPFSFHQSNNTSKLAINCKYELDIFTSNIMSPVLELMTDLTLTLALFLLLISVEPKATLIIIVIFMIAVYVYQNTLKKRTLVWARERQHYDRLINKVIREGLGSIKEIILNLKENFFINKLKHYLHRNFIVAVRAQLTSDLPRHLLELIAIFCFVLIFYFLKFSGYQLFEIIILIGLFAAITFKILPSFNRIMSNIQRVRYAQPVINLLYDELSTVSNQSLRFNNQSDNNFNFKDKLDVRDLTFKYDGKKEVIFEKVNFSIRKGDFIGLSGESGVGKSTLLNLISGLDKNYKGEILIDGKNLKDLNYNWTKKVAYISQNPFFLDDTIKNNIAFAEDEKNISESKIWEAIKASQLEKFVKNLENGLDTIIGEDGTKMSGGQLQRLVIARALYQDFELIILDESLNSLDQENEDKIIDILKGFKRNKTILLISHKDSTLKKCDNILKISQNKILFND